MVKVYEWFEGIFNGLSKAVTAPVFEVKDWIAGKITEGLIGFLKSANPEGTKLLHETLKPLLDNPDIPARFKPIIREWTSSTPPIIAALAPMIGIGFVMGSAMAATAGEVEEIKQDSYSRAKPSILPPNMAVMAKWRGLMSEKGYLQELAWSGYDDVRAGFIETLTEFYPSPQDLIRFMVRDTFNADVVKKYQYDSQYPAAIDEFSKKSGVSPDWMRHFWRAHWELPSPTQMYEMLHRDKITMDDARTLLKTADVAPYFIEPMLAISYNSYTRVDIRRMYEEGVLNKDEVLRAYKDIGYDQAHAEKLTDFTTKEALARERDLTLSQVLDAYTEGEMSAGDAEKELIKLGYDDKESKLVLKLEDAKIERGLRKREKAIFVTKYAKGQITLTQLAEGLNGLKLSEREKKITIEEAKLKVKEAAAAKPA